MKKYLPYFFLVVLSVPLFLLHVPDAHGLGDDFAQYVKEADNISKGKPYYATNWVYNDLDRGYAPPQYPPGFPLLLAPVIKIFGIAIRPMLYMNSLIVAALLFGLFAYFRKYAGDIIAICLSLVIVYSNEIIGAKGELLSDVPCLLFITLYLMVRNSNCISLKRGILLVCLGAMVVLTRSQGLILVAAEGLYLFVAIARLWRAKQLTTVNVKRLPSLWLVCGSLALYIMVNKLLLHAPNSTMTYYARMAQERETTIWQMVKANADYLVTLLRDMLHFPTGAAGVHIMHALEKAALLFGATGLIISLKKVRVDDLFFLLMCLLIIFMPVHQGARFLYEAYPAYLLYVYTGMRVIPVRVPGLRPNALALLLTAVYLLLGYNTFARYSRNECHGCVPSPATDEMFGYLQAHMADSDIVVCPRPRLVTLYTNKRAVVYASRATDEENTRKFAELKVTYFLPWFDDHLRKYMRDNYAVKDSVRVGDALLYRVR